MLNFLVNTAADLSTFALGHLTFSVAGVGVERLFIGAAIQVEGRMRYLSNAALKEKTMIASNRELLNFMDELC